MNIIKFKSNHITIKTALSILALAALVACGSGSSTTDTTTAATPSATPTPTPVVISEPTLVDTFVGTFISNCETNGDKSTIATATFSKVSETQFAGTMTANVYAGTACSGFCSAAAPVVVWVSVAGGTKPI